MNEWVRDIELFPFESLWTETIYSLGMGKVAGSVILYKILCCSHFTFPFPTEESNNCITPLNNSWSILAFCNKCSQFYHHIWSSLVVLMCLWVHFNETEGRNREWCLMVERCGVLLLLPKLYEQIRKEVVNLK